jgi:predicted alpha/beta-hydrolase family hydrolase
MLFMREALRVREFKGRRGGGERGPRARQHEGGSAWVPVTQELRITLVSGTWIISGGGEGCGVQIGIDRGEVNLT